MITVSPRLSSFALVCTTLGLLAGCEYVTADGWIRQPFEGPHYTMDEGLTGDWDDDHTFIISTTFLPVQDSAEAQELFEKRMEGMQELLDDGPEGMIGYSLASRLVGGENRTLTAWASYDALYAFVLSDVHRAAMNDLSDIEVEGAARVHTWEVQQDALPPSWADAEARLDEAGRDAAY